VVFVTHSIAEAVYLSSRIVVMSPRPGRIVKVIESPLPDERTLDMRDSSEFVNVAHAVREALAHGHDE
jgi:NitT/TauT family transport system ATP-binding protein